jgi:hypothetical protein
MSTVSTVSHSDSVFGVESDAVRAEATLAAVSL